MKVLFAINSTEVGGAEKVFGDVARRLRAEGHEAAILVPEENRRRRAGPRDRFQGPADPASAGADLSTPPRYPSSGRAEFPDAWYDRVEEIPLAEFGEPTAETLDRIRRYDLAHLSLLLPHNRRLFRAAGLPLVHTVHSMVGWALCYPFGFAQGERVDAITTVDRSTAAYIRGIYPGLRVRCVVNGIDLVAFAPAAEVRRLPERGLSDPPVVVCVTRLSPWAKNLTMFARVAARVQRAARDAGRPVPVFRLIGGSRPEDRWLDDQLQKVAADAGGEIEITGMVAPESVPAHLAAADVYLQTSAFEGAPLGMLEAMASGLPIVATAVGGVPDLLLPDAGGTPAGTLVRVDDDEAAARAVETLLASDAWRRRMGEQARGRAERDHALGRMTGEYLDLYREILRCG